MLTRAQRIVVTFGGLASLMLGTLMLFNMLSFEFYFMLCLIGFMTIVHLNGPFVFRPRWRSRANVVILVGIVIFVLIVLSKVLDILKIKLF